MRALSRRSFLAGTATAAALAATGGTLAGCSSGDGKVHLELFQFKSEAITLFDQICEDFNAANPDIVVTQNFQADNITSLRARLVKGDTPDLITINGDYNYGALADTGIFYDFNRTDLLDGVNPSIASILDTLGTGGEGQTNGVAFADNGSGIIYNKDVFDSAGVEPPTTWDELIEICDELTAQGIDPFYWAIKDNWTGAPAFSSLSGSYLTDGVAAWYDKRRDLDSGTSFAELSPVFEKMHQAVQYGNADKAALGYNDGNQGFAQGKAAMYWHGTYAIPAIRSYNPDINLGTFATPADNAADTKVVSGVDVALTMGENPAHLEENLRFFKYLMDEANMTAYCDEQVAYPTLTALSAQDPALEGLQPYFDAGRVATYSDHNFPPAITLNAYMQQYLFNGDLDQLITTLDAQWNKVVRRINETA
ncbi:MULTISPECIES: extracellular solute-binding protein [unclassified Actinomyces]|uniref:ABC transporter substrate-binding protein n=1 Tax=unclassified Actinomyces TaxID=2609248 RepID=UPI0013A70596|nr:MULTISPECIES: extracellular solute-binding protein [unclassified Actinomyces]MBW3069846.1 extracellular solute-binding protein [Actinomyces sp. 594]NDR53893.1 extracellular solute-binding protein [Actinomyces sp. 565]